MGHLKKLFSRLVAPPRMPSLTPRGGVRKRGPRIFLRPPVRVFRNLDPTFARPAPPTRDRGIGRAQLKKFKRQRRLKARSRQT